MACDERRGRETLRMHREPGRRTLGGGRDVLEDKSECDGELEIDVSWQREIALARSVIP